MLWVHFFILTGTNAIDALEASFLTELHGRDTTVQVWGCGECLVLGTSHVGDVLEALNHVVKEEVSRLCVIREDEEEIWSLRKIGRYESLRHTKQ